MGKDLNGLLVLDKPTGITSRDAVNRAQDWFPPRTRIGHTGTLDPLATGVLVVCIGSATRLAEYVQAMDKVYRSTFVLGARSDTDDADGQIVASDATAASETALQSALAGFEGTIEQRPPAYSAIKVEGKRAHQLARKGEHVEITARRVTIYGTDMLRYDWQEVDLEIRCGKGTYIRSLARDLGERLGCGAYVKTLRRTRVGPFMAEHGLSLEATATEAQARLLSSASAVAHLPSLHVNEDLIHRLRQGQSVPIAKATDAPECAVFDEAGRLVAIGTLKDGFLRSLKNLL